MMFQPGDKVRWIAPERDKNKIWTVLDHPYKQWHEQMVSLGDENGMEQVANVKDLLKIDNSGFECDTCKV